MTDYMFPEWVVQILKTPSERTQMESSLVGITVMMLSSLFISSYVLINMALSVWFKIALAVGEFGVLSFQFALLSTTYQQYRQYKLQNELYPVDYKMKMKIEEAILLKEELVKLINENTIK